MQAQPRQQWRGFVYLLFECITKLNQLTQQELIAIPQNSLLNLIFFLQYIMVEHVAAANYFAPCYQNEEKKIK